MVKGLFTKDFVISGDALHELCRVKAVIPAGTEVQKFAPLKMSPLSRELLGVGRRRLFGYVLNSGTIQLIYDPFQKYWKGLFYGKAIKLDGNVGAPMQHMVFPH